MPPLQITSGIGIRTAGHACAFQGFSIKRDKRLSLTHGVWKLLKKSHFAVLTKNWKKKC